MCDSLLNDEYLRHAKNPMPGAEGLISETQGGGCKEQVETAENPAGYTHRTLDVLSMACGSPKQSTPLVRLKPKLKDAPDFPPHQQENDLLVICYFHFFPSAALSSRG